MTAEIRKSKGGKKIEIHQYNVGGKSSSTIAFSLVLRALQ